MADDNQVEKSKIVDAELVENAQPAKPVVSKEEHKLTLSKQKFLLSQNVEEQQQVSRYSLGKEFAKTKKNVSPVFYLVLIGFLSVLIAGTLLFSSLINRSYEMGIGADIFEDVELKDLLATSRSIQKKLQETQNSIFEFKQGHARKIKDLQEKHLSELKAINQQEISLKERLKLSNEKEKELKNKIHALNLESQKNISSKQRAAGELRDQLKKKKQQLDKSVEKSQEIANNYAKLRQLKLTNQLYKYNPSIRDWRVIRILKEKNEFSPKTYPKLSNYKDSFAKENILEQASYAQRLKKIKQRNILMERMLAIPYTNSVPRLLGRIHSLNKSINQNYENLWQTLYTDLVKREQLLRSHRYALTYLARQDGEVGYILDPRKPQRIGLYLADIFEPNDKTRASVFRRAETYIGEIELFRLSGRQYRGRVIKLASGQQMKPFDRLVLLKNKNTSLKKRKQAVDADGTDSKQGQSDIQQTGQ